MKQLLILAHAPSPNTQRIVEALADSAAREAPKIRIVCKAPLASDATDIMQCDGIILFTPENFGYMSGALKDFFDRTFYELLEQTSGLPYALVIRAGKDGTGCKRAVESITQGLGWKGCQEPLVLRGDYSHDFLTLVKSLAGAFAAGLELGIL